MTEFGKTVIYLITFQYSTLVTWIFRPERDQGLDQQFCKWSYKRLGYFYTIILSPYNLFPFYVIVKLNVDVFNHWEKNSENCVWRTEETVQNKRIDQKEVVIFTFSYTYTCLNFH